MYLNMRGKYAHIILFVVYLNLCDGFNIFKLSSILVRQTTRLRQLSSVHPLLPKQNIKSLFKKSCLNAASINIDKKEESFDPTTEILGLNLLVVRCSWVTWWIQIILSVISAVILTFANTVRQSGNQQSFISSGFALSGIGIVIAFINTFWTWATTRVCRRVLSGKIENIKIIPTFRRYFQVSVAISLIGTFFSLLGAEQIVGTLASKVLTIQGFQPYVSGPAQSAALQALDIFLVQANTNALLANFAPNLCFSFLQTQLPKTDLISLQPSPSPEPVLLETNKNDLRNK